ncbi:DUF4190 domain-containing protein [Desmospora activa]|uniref:DUF4190 domain-containing protein n=1 Tax=Desmospora activa DSM 45169 TaxID=1121389 RepID=A0A2T4ZDV4_9BACL|nr:DUF4190 domain-containing protein [Desmospora activa]PTM60075.1 hypothetical protein C8J48_2723 [Desmospora activa DSM 45169]
MEPAKQMAKSVRGNPALNGQALIAMITGITSLVFTFISPLFALIFGIFSPLFCLVVGAVALILGFVARSAESSGQAKAGIIMGAISVVLSIGFSLLLLLGTIGFLMLPYIMS